MHHRCFFRLSDLILIRELNSTLQGKLDSRRVTQRCVRPLLCTVVLSSASKLAITINRMLMLMLFHFPPMKSQSLTLLLWLAQSKNFITRHCYKLSSYTSLSLQLFLFWNARHLRSVLHKMLVCGNVVISCCIIIVSGRGCGWTSCLI